MELHRLRFFVAVAESGGLGRAARALGLAPQAVSQQVAALERSLGARLFARAPGDAGGATLTPAGAALLPEARAALAAAERGAAAARAAARAAVAGLRVGLPDFAPYAGRMADALAAFRAAHPAAHVEVAALPWAGHVAAVLARALDVGVSVCGEPADYPPGVGASPLAREPGCCALVAAGSPLATRAAERAADGVGDGFGDEAALDPAVLARHPLHLVPAAALPWVHRRALAALSAVGCAPPLAEPAPSFVNAAALVAAGEGWMLALDAAGRAPPPGLVARPVRGLVLPLRVDAVWRRDSPNPLTRAFIAALRAGGRGGVRARAR